jgi:hypothetical protein
MYMLQHRTDNFIKDEFYQKLERVCDSLATNDTIIMIGDLNPRWALGHIVYIRYPMTVGANS